MDSRRSYPKMYLCIPDCMLVRSHLQMYRTRTHSQAVQSVNHTSVFLCCMHCTEGGCGIMEDCWFVPFHQIIPPIMQHRSSRNPIPLNELIVYMTIDGFPMVKILEIRELFSLCLGTL